MKKRLSASVLLALASVCVARPVAYWPYEQLAKEADLIVIATPTQTEDTGEKTNFAGFASGIIGLGVNTTFQVLTVLKGEKELKTFVLFHLRAAEPGKIALCAPELVSFNPKEKKRYLLFLKREVDGHFSSLCGQTDPAGAVKDLGDTP